MPSSVNLRPVLSCRPLNHLCAFIALASASAWGCSLPQPAEGTDIVRPDGGRYYVAHTELKRRVNHTDLLTVDVVFPASSDRSGVPLGRYPGLIFMQDKGVAPDAYRWLTDLIAAWGYVVAIPHDVGDDPRLAPGTASAGFDLLNDPPAGLLVGRVDTAQMKLFGHGEGGRIAAKVVGDRLWTSLTLLGALPDEGDRAGLSALPWRVYLGTEDCKIARSEAERVISTDNLTLLEGVGHEQFYEGGKAASGCPSTVADDVARAAIGAALASQLVIPDTTNAGTDAGAADDAATSTNDAAEADGGVTTPDASADGGGP